MTEIKQFINFKMQIVVVNVVLTETLCAIATYNDIENYITVGAF